jgi:hypothetical protein
MFNTICSISIIYLVSCQTLTTHDGELVEYSLKDSVFSAVFRATYGKTYQLERSTDLKIWTVLTESLCDDGTVTLSSPEDAAQVAAFFRIVAK